MPPRVLQCVLNLNPGGTERLVIELARRLHPDVPTAICCLDSPGAWSSEVTEAGIAVHALHRAPGFVPRLGQAIARLAAQHRATVVHCHHYSPFIYGALARLWQPSLRVVYTEHGRLSDAPPSVKRRTVNLAFSRVPSAVFAVSEDLRRHMTAEGFPDRSSAVIYNGIDPGPAPSHCRRLEARRRLGVSDDTVVVATIARLDPVKDLETLIHAVAKVIDVPILLLVIGDGPEREKLTQEAATSGVAARVRFLGHRDDAREWLPASDIYVNSSISEGVSLTILEAMAAALPVIATGVGGTPEVLDEVSGTLVPSRNPLALAAALSALAGDSGRRQAMGDAARRRVEAHFTVDRMVAEYRQVYERLA